MSTTKKMFSHRHIRLDGQIGICEHNIEQYKRAGWVNKLFDERVKMKALRHELAKHLWEIRNA